VGLSETQQTPKKEKKRKSCHIMKHMTLDKKSDYVRDSLILLNCPNASDALRKCEELEVELNKLNWRLINGAHLNFDLSELELSRMVV